MTSRTLHLSRADLLRLIGDADPEEREAIAALVGFERREPEPPPDVPPEKPSATHEEQAFEPPLEKEIEVSPPVAAKPIFWRVVEQRTLPEQLMDDDELPAWWTSPPEPPPEIEPDKTPSGSQSLLHWPRLLGFYRSHLVMQRRSNHPDEQRLVRQISEKRFVRKVPRKHYKRWPQRLIVLLDNSHALYPLWQDYAQMVSRLRDLFGVRLNLIRVAAQSKPTASGFNQLLAENKLTPESAVNAYWLILSDMGAAEGYTEREPYWRAFLHWLQYIGIAHPPLALVNAPESRWWYGLGELAKAAFWDLDQPLRISRGSGESATRNEADITKLLSMLAMAPEARPRLLRELRRLLPEEEQDVSWEISAWNHPDVANRLPNCGLMSGKRPLYQKRFLRDMANSTASHERPFRALEVITIQLADKPAFIYDQARALERAAKRQTDPEAGYLVDSIKALRDLPKGDEREQRLHWVKELLASTDRRLIGASEKLRALRYIKDHEMRQRGETTPPLEPYFDFIFREKPEQAYLLWQQGTGWGVASTSASLPTSGSPLGSLRSRSRYFELEPIGVSNESDDFWVGGVAPGWVSAWGEDTFGRWAEFEILAKSGQSVTQRLRWIDPGTFRMGSPEDEQERSSDEVPHPVTLSQGYWLADTACTQALWEAVMGENPSGFKGAERPVEQVSWEATIVFIKRLNAQVAGLNLRLPTEAEWEYACRAGAQTPFWFGDNISTDQLNYDGNYPYAGGKKGKFRNGTVEVKALPCNGWGLYQMHGNVYEWCHDWYGEYPKASVTDPQGPEEGEGRVLRGGGWLGFGRYARSARRNRDAPVYRSNSFGFRLARGQSGGQVGAEPAGPRSARQAVRRADVGRPSAAPVPQLDYRVVTPPPALPAQRLRVASDREVLTLEALTQPDWAETLGRDRFGLFAEFRVREVVQRLRWINPGRFLMGSPENELERRDDETQHEVTLTQGFWLADTTCTQALWEAVMGENPSHFKGKERPVEQVSWEDSVTFIEQLNAMVNDLYLRLPTEAEWEYACRAGTQTPFWLGDNISTEQVNYLGVYPYAGGSQGENRVQTVEVKRLPCNDWGLYQMHGNIWEWCGDWYADYPKESVMDPQGPVSGEGRVLRGGGLIFSGRIERSARRGHYAPVGRENDVGFRLARGQSSQAGDQALRGTGQAARSDDGSGSRKAWSRLKEFFSIRGLRLG